MDYLAVSLRHCYGIKSFTKTFDFTQKPTCGIYAPNGIMKTSFAKTLMDYSKGVDSRDEIYPERTTIRQIEDEEGNEIPPEKIFVIEPYNSSYRSTKMSTLLVNNSLREEYENIIEDIEKALEALMQPIRKLSGIRKEVAPVISSDIMGTSKEIYLAIQRVKNEVNQIKGSEWSHITYNSIFSPRVEQLLEDDEFVNDLTQYAEIYDSLIERSVYFRKGVFNHNNADTIAKNLSDNGFFLANHAINLFDQETYISIKSIDELKNVIQNEKDKIIENTELKRAFEVLDKKLKANKEFRDFRKYLSDNPEILPELENPSVFKQKLWLSYFRDNIEQYNALLESYENGKARTDEIVAAARAESTLWNSVVQIFNSRFSVPFKLRVENQEDVILKKEGPSVAFVFSDENNTRPVKEQILLKVLSNGEKRALYLLNTIFEIEARKASGQETFFIIDDIADSFDYKNKYAIIEYLKDITNEPFFRQIIFTHNFDFFRTISSRLDMGRPHKFHCRKTMTEVSLVEEKYQNNPFITWKNNLHLDNAMLIASIPFVRNIAEYSGDDANFAKLTSLLHIKNDSRTITVSDLESIHKSILKDKNNLSLPDGHRLLIEMIFTEADTIEALRGVHVDLEKKIVLAIAIRLKCEEYLIGRINNQEFVNSINKNQTFRLCKKFKETFPLEKEVLDILDQINLMTPENIHLNSFMYEPLLDLSDLQLKALYGRVKQL
ncbi:hypothetical protein [Lewinella sp. IMCC34191]|uniref:hypothetical protein n=1 Tax=Lewinella sp. IMCC34191 TaxID=2259172 RepID=UPI000E23E47E|nr:hypothetical protein [Lewinella sp. IMCC34191]